MTLKMLAACEESGRVRDAFAERDWDAWSCDLLPSSSPVCQSWGDGKLTSPLLEDHGVNKNCTNHYQGDVRDIISQDWDLVIAFPPCDHLSLAGARWWAAKQADGRQQAGAEFFMSFFDLVIPSAYLAIENPRGIMSRLFRQPDQVVEPWWFGDPYSKKTCLWFRDAELRGINDTFYDKLPLLQPQNAISPEHRVSTGGGSWKVDKLAGHKGMSNYEDSMGRKNRSLMRSKTFPGFAQAMADQWGPYVEGKAIDY